MTAWDCLRTDWPHLVEAIADDELRRIEVHTESGGSITCVNLADLEDLQATFKQLVATEPDPLEIVVRADKDTLILRSRHRRDGGYVKTKTEITGHLELANKPNAVKANTAQSLFEGQS